MTNDCPPDCGGCGCMNHPPCHHCTDHTFEPVKCVMCKEDFREADLDFIGRCTPCFKAYMLMTDEEKAAMKLGVPYSPIYNGKAKYGF